MSESLGSRYRRDGFVTLPVVDQAEAATHRSRLEWAEDQIGPQHYRDKAHTILTSPWELATHPAMLDAVEACIGPDILIYNTMYIVKEPGSSAKVNWHQDLTYWGLSDDDAQVSGWIALSPATFESGCMRMVPGSHQQGRVDHRAEGPDEDDVLRLGQSIPGVDETKAVHVELEPGWASLHHGWTMHASTPNRSTDRRIGVNVQYLAPHCKQLLHDEDTAVLVRGEDRFGHFAPEVVATTDLDPEAVAKQAEHQERIVSTYDVARSKT